MKTTIDVPNFHVLIDGEGSPQVSHYFESMINQHKATIRCLAPQGSKPLALGTPVGVIVGPEGPEKVDYDDDDDADDAIPKIFSA